MRHYVTNEFNNSGVGKAIAIEKRDRQHGRVTFTFSFILFVLVIFLIKRWAGG